MPITPYPDGTYPTCERHGEHAGICWPCADERGRASDRAPERLTSGIATIQLAAWGEARVWVNLRRRRKTEWCVYDLADQYEATCRAYLAALYYLDATPGGEPMDVTSLFGARAWAMGEEVRS